MLVFMLMLTNYCSAVRIKRKGGVAPFLFILFSLFVLFSFSLPSFGSSSNSDIDYLIIDKTKTPWGHKFYKTFSEVWKPPKGIDGYFIIIEEKKPSFRQSWIYIKVGDNIYMRIVYYSMLKPTTSNFDMQRQAVVASKRVLKYLLTDFLKFKAENEKF